jgi:nicotinamide-nucleotide amidase
MLRCDLLAVGNELLDGEIRDLNLYTLSRRLTRLGLTVVKAAICRDLTASIAEALTYLLSDTPDVIICCGGLGPTDDDLTLRAIAEATGRQLTLNAEARQMVTEHYERLIHQNYLQQLGPETARTKMATLPEGAIPLHNPVGTAPGAALALEDTWLYVLPGVPAEMEAIFDETIAEQLHQKFDLKRFIERVLYVHVDDEADVAGPLEEVRRRYPEVYLKSLAQPFPAAGKEGLRIIASTQAAHVEDAERKATAALRDLSEILEGAGFRISAIQGEDHVA